MKRRVILELEAGNMALEAAVQGGQRGSLKELVKLGVDLQLKANPSAFFWALAEQGVGLKSVAGSAVLVSGVERGSRVIVNELTKRGVDLMSWACCKALGAAVMNINLNIVKELVERSLNLRSDAGSKPLLLVIAGAKRYIGKELRKRGVDL